MFLLAIKSWLGASCKEGSTSWWPRQPQTLKRSRLLAQGSASVADLAALCNNTNAPASTTYGATEAKPQEIDAKTVFKHRAIHSENGVQSWRWRVRPLPR